jgi:hypothetical protein
MGKKSKDLKKAKAKAAEKAAAKAAEAAVAKPTVPAAAAASPEAAAAAEAAAAEAAAAKAARRAALLKQLREMNRKMRVLGQRKKQLHGQEREQWLLLPDEMQKYCVVVTEHQDDKTPNKRSIECRPTAKLLKLLNSFAIMQQICVFPFEDPRLRLTFDGTDIKGTAVFEHSYEGFAGDVVTDDTKNWFKLFQELVQFNLMDAVNNACCACGLHDASGTATTQRCSRCFTAAYCSDTCSHANWPTHKHQCEQMHNSFEARKTVTDDGEDDFQRRVSKLKTKMLRKMMVADTMLPASTPK